MSVDVICQKKSGTVVIISLALFCVCEVALLSSSRGSSVESLGIVGVELKGLSGILLRVRPPVQLPLNSLVQLEFTRSAYL
jgi:hypothetical protein